MSSTQHMFLARLSQQQSQDTQQSHESLQSIPLDDAQVTIQYLEHMLSEKYSAQLSDRSRTHISNVIQLVRRLDKIDRRAAEDEARKLIEKREALEAKRREKLRKEEDAAEAFRKAQEEEATKVRLKKEADAEAMRKAQEEDRLKKEAELKEAQEKKRIEDEARQKQEEEDRKVAAALKQKEDERLKQERLKAEEERKQQEIRDEKAREDERYRKLLRPIAKERITGFFDTDDSIERHIINIMASDVQSYDGVEAIKTDLKVQFDTDKAKFLDLKKKIEDKLDEIEKDEPKGASIVASARKMVTAKLKEVYSARRRYPKPKHMIGNRDFSMLDDEDELSFF